MADEALFSRPKQQRSRETLDRVLEVATEMLQEVGYDDMHIAQIGKRANVGTASIYARVGSKHGLLLAVQSRMVDQLDAEAEAMLEPMLDFAGSFEDLVRNAVVVGGRLFRQHEPLLRVFMIRADVDSTVVAHGSDSSVKLGELFARILLTRRDEITHGEPERAVDVCFRFVYDTLARRVMRGAGFESRRNLPWDDLVAELALASGAYLRFSGALAAG